MDKVVQRLPGFLRKRLDGRPNLRKILENIGWLFFDRILRMGVGLLIGVWVARYLGPEQFGLLSFATAFAGMFTAIATLGLQNIVVRDIVRDPAGKETTLGTAAALQILGGLLAYGFMIGTVFWLRADDPLAKLLVAIVGVTMLHRASDVAVYWFESQVLSKYIVWVQNGVFMVVTLVKVALILTDAPLIAFAWASAANALAVSALMLLILGLRGPRLRQLRVSWARAKTLLADAWPLMLSGIAGMIYMKIDQIMLGMMIGDEAVGIYSAAVRISGVWYFPPMVIVASVFPALLEAKNRSEALYYKRLQRLYDSMLWLAIAVALPMTFLASPLVVLMFGDAYAASGPVLALHIWTAVFGVLGVVTSRWIWAENRQILDFQRAALGAGSNIFLNWLLIPRYGPLGAAFTTVMSCAIADLFFDLIRKETRRIFRMKVKSFLIWRYIGAKWFPKPGQGAK